MEDSKMSFAKKINEPEQPLKITLKELLGSSQDHQAIVEQLERFEQQSQQTNESQ